MHVLWTPCFTTETKSKSKKKRVLFETRQNPEIEAEAMKLFLLFENGDAGYLSFNELQLAMQEMGIDVQSEKVR